MRECWGKCTEGLISHLTECDIVQLAISLGEQRLSVDDTSTADVTEVDDVDEVVG